MSSAVSSVVPELGDPAEWVPSTPSGSEPILMHDSSSAVSEPSEAGSESGGNDGCRQAGSGVGLDVGFVGDVRAAVVYHVPAGQSETAAVPPAEPATLRILERALSRHWLAKHLPADVNAELAAGMSRHEFSAGEKIVSRGCVSHHAWLVLGGRCEIEEVTGDEGFSLDLMSPPERITREVEAGEWVASSSLVLPCRQAASVRAVSGCVLWSLGRAAFQRRLKSAAQAKLWTRLDMLHQCEWLQSLPPDKLGRLAVAGRLHCCPVGSRAAFSSNASSSPPRCRYVVENVLAQKVTGTGDVGRAPGLTQRRWPGRAAEDWRGATSDKEEGREPEESGTSDDDAAEEVEEEEDHLWFGALSAGGRGRVRPLRPQAIDVLKDRPTLLLFERVVKRDNSNGAGTVQEAIARVYPVGPEEARQEWLEHQQEKEQLAARRREIEATKQRRKGRPSAAEQGLRSAVRNYGNTSPPSLSRKAPLTRVAPFEAPVSTPPVAAATQHNSQNTAGQAAVNVAHVALNELEFFEEEDGGGQAMRYGDDGPASGSRGSVHVSALDATSPEAFFLATAFLAVTPSTIRPANSSVCLAYHRETAAYFHVRATPKKTLVGSERQAQRWLAALGLWGKMPKCASLLPLAAVAEDASHIYTMVPWAGRGAPLQRLIRQMVAEQHQRSTRSPSPNGSGAGGGRSSPKFHQQKPRRRGSPTRSGAVALHGRQSPSLIISGGGSPEHAAAAWTKKDLSRLRPRAVAYYAVQVVQALDALHASHIVYRALAPSALLLDSRGHVVLGGFALARRLQDGKRAYTLCAGALGYLAPEQLTGAGHGTGVDVWALGVLLCELLTGRHPFVAALGPDHDNNDDATASTVCGGYGDSRSNSDSDSDAGSDSEAAAVKERCRRGVQETATQRRRRRRQQRLDTDPLDMERAFRAIIAASLEDGPAFNQLQCMHGGGTTTTRTAKGPSATAVERKRLAAPETQVLSLLRGILDPVPARRPGFAGRTAAILKHPWFGATLGESIAGIWDRSDRQPPLRIPSHLQRTPPEPGSSGLDYFPF